MSATRRGVSKTTLCLCLFHKRCTVLYVRDRVGSTRDTGAVGRFPSCVRSVRVSGSGVRRPNSPLRLTLAAVMSSTPRSTEETLHSAISMANATRIVPAGYPRSAGLVADAIADIPVNPPRIVDDTPPAGLSSTTKKKTKSDLVGLRSQSIFFITG